MLQKTETPPPAGTDEGAKDVAWMPCGQSNDSTTDADEPRRTIVATVIKARQPLSKRLTLGADEQLTKQPARPLTAGVAQIVAFKDMRDLAARLDRMDERMVLTCGVPAGVAVGAKTRIATASKIAEGKAPEGAIARTRENFTWPSRRMPVVEGERQARIGALAVFDFDEGPDGQRPTRAEAEAILLEALPEARGCAILWRPSQGAGVVREGEPLDGELRGWHAFLVVDRDTASTPADVGQIVVDRLWASGRGWYVLSAAGTPLARTPIDASVWQPERVLYEGPPVLGDGLALAPERQSVLVNPDGGWLEGPLLSEIARADLREEARAAQREAHAQFLADPEIADAVSAATQKRATDLAKRSGISTEAAASLLGRASSESVLEGDFVLRLRDPATREPVEITVAEVLRDRWRWHKATGTDPLEPDYGGGSLTKAVLLLDRISRPVLYSHAHGGRMFSLVAAPKTLTYEPNMPAKQIREILQRCGDAGAMYWSPTAGGVVVLTPGSDDALPKPCRVDELSLRTAISDVVSLQKVSKKRGGETREEMEITSSMARMILSTTINPNMPEIYGVADAPVVRADGSVATRCGYDSASRYLLIGDFSDLEVRRIKQREAAELVDKVLLPFREYAFNDSDVARGVLLGIALTTIVRPVLPTAPGAIITASRPGSGKTLLASTLPRLVGETANYPPDLPKDKQDLIDELASMPRVLIYDNFRGFIKNRLLELVLTSPSLFGRIKYARVSGTIDARCQFVLTGNGLTPNHDLARRCLSLSIDPQCATPTRRSFNTYPPGVASQHRREIQAAAASLISSAVAAGAPVPRCGSFVEWAGLVARTVLWATGVDLGAHLSAQESQALEEDGEIEGLGGLLAAIGVLRSRHLVRGRKAQACSNFAILDALRVNPNAEPPVEICRARDASAEFADLDDEAGGPEALGADGLSEDAAAALWRWLGRPGSKSDFKERLRRKVPRGAHYEIPQEAVRLAADLGLGVDPEEPIVLVRISWRPRAGAALNDLAFMTKSEAGNAPRK